MGKSSKVKKAMYGMNYTGVSIIKTRYALGRLLRDYAIEADEIEKKYKDRPPSEVRTKALLRVLKLRGLREKASDALDVVEVL